ncbi:5-carboxymethyl-2-hydroxymuconate isomerase [Pseudomonas sp. SDI]|uniref:5-carboxymethyl-2-hydroxymuconate Delta-isomerase n=1 Tax=Pseudomonas sp. SDI TaxID=2170734 RepID=UPI000DE7387C|nr:5-carboxymethyl-2-hydroxymuconate Delta-isomerase [Pseudomonas sp. SDI]PWB34684.1 5-carboxymethyl-2-hydroxymuconate isomerase [Pseudomonas sp. SDI]
MPHLHLEHSNNLNELEVDKVLLRLNHALVASGQFDNELDIKSRAVCFDEDHFRVGVAPLPRAFVHVKLALLSGRSAEVKRQLSAGLLDVLKDTVKAPEGIDLQLCAEILDIDRDSYAKAHIPG